LRIYLIKIAHDSRLYFLVSIQRSTIKCKSIHVSCHNYLTTTGFFNGIRLL